ncbi:MAG: molybdenum cofactor biosynthesis protein MoaE [Acidimicrobiia bacterium]
MGRLPDASAQDWLGLTDAALPVAEALQWAVMPHCGAAVLFCGVVRDHAEGRPGVSSLHYEAFEEEVEPRLASIAAETRRRWPDVARLAILHRTGTLGVGEVSVAIVASAPHRAEAFDAARFAIDTVKTSVPIWKRETWAGGEDWSACDHPLEEVSGP